MSVLSLSYWESDVYWRQNNKHFAEFAPQNGGKQLIWRNYVTVTICIPCFFNFSSNLWPLLYSGHNGRDRTVQVGQTTAASSRRQGLRSSTDASSYTVPMTYTKFGERAFSVAGPSVWNSLPSDIRHITDISKFKRHLKTYLFNLYFNT